MEELTLRLMTIYVMVMSSIKSRQFLSGFFVNPVDILQTIKYLSLYILHVCVCVWGSGHRDPQLVHYGMVSFVCPYPGQRFE